LVEKKVEEKDKNEKCYEYIHKDVVVEKLVNSLSEYQIVAHDGRGLHGEHYFIRERELRSIIEEALNNLEE